MKTWVPGNALPGTERPFYLQHHNELLCVVHHAAAGPHCRATVVLAGPMTLERSHGYLTWVRWARQLALNGYDVYRFDYRGVGESTGDFRQQTFTGWQEDLAALTAHAKRQRHGRVVVLGLRLGALLAQRVFDAGDADAFIAWDPPAGGKPMLMDMLRRKLAADYMEFGGQRKTREEYVRELEAGQLVEAEGYAWSKGLWQSAEAFVFAAPRRIAGEWFVVYLDGRAVETLPNRDFYTSVRIPKPAFWLQSPHLVPDLETLFTGTLERLHRWTEGWSISPQVEAAVAQTPPVPPEHGRGLALDVLDLEAGRCVGTVHTGAPRTTQVGLLWVNFGYVPRDGHGGLATQVSEALAAKGVPCFRYDLPGLGDAPGPLPAHTQQFFPIVTSGTFTTITSQLVRALCERHGLNGLVIAGLCGGAVNAIFTADAQKDLVKGLLLLEPEMYVTEPKKDADTPRQGTRERMRAQLPKDNALTPLLDRVLTARLPYEEKLRSKLFSYWGWMRLLTDENVYARYVPLPKKAILDFVLSRSELPSVTNLPLTDAWRRWVKDNRPVLVITADGKLREVFFDRINGTALNGITKSSYEHLRLKGTNHIFTTGGAIDTVTRTISGGWKIFRS